MISKPELQQGITATHILESQELRMRFVWALRESGCEDVRDGEGKAEGDGVKARQARSVARHHTTH